MLYAGIAAGVILALMLSALPIAAGHLASAIARRIADRKESKR